MSDTIQISEANLSLAWLKALSAVLDNKNKPLCISILGLEKGIQEDPQIREELDSLLSGHNEISVKGTSETLFPHSYWISRQPSFSALSSWYLNRYLPKHRARLKKLKPSTPRETYFERLIAYPGFHNVRDKFESIKINQLERIIDIFRHYNSMGTNPSPSKFIATCLNPSVDNTDLAPYLPFPCLQQIGFSFSGGSITLSAYYTIQYLMKRGYGNYLGLCYLGQFMANESGIPLTRVNCFIGNPRVDGFSRKELNSILNKLS